VGGQSVTQEMLDAIRSAHARLSDVSEVAFDVVAQPGTRWAGATWTRTDGSATRLVIEVVDVSEGPHRWRVEAVDLETDCVATGNPEATLVTALAVVHWGELQ
jgi:hypothetical protein